MPCKMILVLLFCGLAAFSDWEQDVYSTLNSIDGSVTQIVPDVESIKTDIYNIRNSVKDISYLTKSFKATAPSGYTQSAWFLEMVEGVGYSEHRTNDGVYVLDRENIGTGYDNMISLKSKYFDMSQNYVDMVAYYTRDIRTDEHFDFSKYRSGVYQSAPAPDAFLSAGMRGDLITKSATEGTDFLSRSQQDYITSHVDSELTSFRSQAEWYRQHALGAVNNALGSYTGHILEFDLGFLHDLIYNLSGQTIDVPEFSSEVRYVISLVPAEGDWFWPFYQVWTGSTLSAMRTALTYAVCYGAVFWFIYSKVSEILTK